jgi:hypothetical protein
VGSQGLEIVLLIRARSLLGGGSLPGHRQKYLVGRDLDPTGDLLIEIPPQSAQHVRLLTNPCHPGSIGLLQLIMAIA